MKVYHFRTLEGFVFVILFIAQTVIIESATKSPKKIGKLFVIKITNSAEKDVESIVKELDLIYRGPVGTLNDKYLVEEKEESIRGHSYHVGTVQQKLQRHKDVLNYEEQIPLPPRVKRGDFNDEKYSQQWYLGPSNQGSPQKKYFNMPNVWKLGYTGRGVQVTIVDDGLDHTHKDLKKNYDPGSSRDFNNNDPDPLPRSTIDDRNNHGTRCAGEVAAEANNSVCGVGIAYDASIGGIKILDTNVFYDAIEAQALSFNNSHIDIYSNSWGPEDDGKTMDAPREQTIKVIEEGVRSGRNGLGSIYLFAGGNGGLLEDSCSWDGYVMLPETIAINAVDYLGNPPPYAERCPGIFACAYSSGYNSNKWITTTDLNNKCTDSFTGTSAATPLAAGIIALLLEANPNVTWRDVQHLIARTSTKINPTHKSWVENGVGIFYSVYYGFGVINPERLIKEATNSTWETVGKRHTCIRKFYSKIEKKYFDRDNELLLKHYSTCCHNGNVCRMEHVTVQMTFQAERRGSVRITLQSPSETKSPLLEQRDYDAYNGEVTGWNFTSLSFWDENPNGEWILNVSSGRGFVKSVQITIYGTTTNFTQQKKRPLITFFSTKTTQASDVAPGKPKVRRSVKTIIIIIIISPFAIIIPLVAGIIIIKKYIVKRKTNFTRNRAVFSNEGFVNDHEVRSATAENNQELTVIVKQTSIIQ